MADINNLILSDEQKRNIAHAHIICAKRMAVKLPTNVNSPRCREIDLVQEYDAQVEEIAKNLNLQRLMRAATATEPAVTSDVPEREAAQIVWQLYHIEHPHRFGSKSSEIVAS